MVYYRSFQFADSLEGTRASLMRHRKQSPNMPEYLPSNFNSRQQTANSILLTDEVITDQNDGHQKVCYIDESINWDTGYSNLYCIAGVAEARPASHKWPVKLFLMALLFFGEQTICMF